MSEAIESNLETEAAEASARRRAIAWSTVAFLLFLLLSVLNFREVWSAGLDSSALGAFRGQRTDISNADVTFEAWLVARNARTLVQNPANLFETEHCAPTEKTMTLCVPMITMGLLAIPVALFTPNPALAYNFATLMLWVISAFAMYLLVKDWTGIPAAGIVAGLFFAFGSWRGGAVTVHPSEFDATWTVFALYFSQRLFGQGRWRDAVGLALAISLQIAASFYELVAAAFFAPPFIIWLLARDRLGNVRLAQVAFVLIAVGVTSFLLLGPFLDANNSGTIGNREQFYNLKWSSFAPNGAMFLGWNALALAALGLCLPRRLATPAINGDPRWALVVGSLLVTVIVAGPDNGAVLESIWPDAPIRIPHFYLLLAEVIPGLDSIRVIFRLGVIMLITLCILSGIGAAWLIRIIPFRTPVLAAALIGIAALTTAFAPIDRKVIDVAADPAEVKFFEALKKLGNEGAILELPLPYGPMRIQRAPHWILLSAYHQRRTSSCFGSYRAPGREELEALAKSLPGRSAVQKLSALGFTTVVLRDAGSRSTSKIERRFERKRDNGLSLFLKMGGLLAYVLQP